MWNVGTKRSPDHMKSEQGAIREICPKTGEHTAPKELSKRFVVKRYLMGSSKLPHPLDKYKAMGTKKMTDEQINSAYGIIKGMMKCRIV